IAGALDISGDGKGTLRAAGPNRISVESLNARIAATGIRATDRNLGNLQLTANGAGDKVNFALESDLANSAIRGHGNATLHGDYPVDGELTFNELSWKNLQPLVSGSSASPVDGVTSGRITVNGPAANVDQLNASLRLTKFQIRSDQSP